MHKFCRIAYCDYGVFMFLASINLLDEVLGVFDGDLMWVSIEAVHHRYHVLLAALHPPRLKTQGGYVLYNRYTREITYSENGWNVVSFK